MWRRHARERERCRRPVDERAVRPPVLWDILLCVGSGYWRSTAQQCETVSESGKIYPSGARSRECIDIACMNILLLIIITSSSRRQVAAIECCLIARSEISVQRGGRRDSAVCSSHVSLSSRASQLPWGSDSTLNEAIFQLSSTHKTTITIMIPDSVRHVHYTRLLHSTSYQPLFLSAMCLFFCIAIMKKLDGDSS